MEPTSAALRRPPCPPGRRHHPPPTRRRQAWRAGLASLLTLAAPCFLQIRFVLLLSRQGKVRLAKWYTTLSQKDRAKITKEVSG